MLPFEGDSVRPERLDAEESGLGMRCGVSWRATRGGEAVAGSAGAITWCWPTPISMRGSRCPDLQRWQVSGRGDLAEVGRGCSTRPRPDGWWGGRSGWRWCASRTGWPPTCGGRRWRGRRPGGPRSWARSRTWDAAGASPTSCHGTTPTSGRSTCPAGWPRWRRRSPTPTQFDAIIVDEAQDFAVDRRYLLRPRHGLQRHGAGVAVHGWAGAWSVARRRWAYARQPSSSMSSRTARAPTLSLHSGSLARRELRASARTRSASVASCW